MKLPENPFTANKRRLEALEQKTALRDKIIESQAAEIKEQAAKLLELQNPKRAPLIEFGKTDENQSYLIASSDQSNALLANSATVHEILSSAGLIAKTFESMNSNIVNPLQLARLGNVPREGVITPVDFADYQDYWDSYLLVPRVNRSVTLKHNMIWQSSYDIQCADADEGKRVKAYLEENVDSWLIDGSLYSLVFGNMYWHVNNSKDEFELEPLNPATVGVCPKDLKHLRKGIKSYITFEGLSKIDEFPVDEVLQLSINKEPWAYFGYGSIRCVLPTVKAILYMEKKLPWLARRLAHPLLCIDINDSDTGIASVDCFKRAKTMLETRPDGADIYNDGTITKIEEVYKNVGNSRQLVEPLLDHFGKDLTAGLGVPEIAQGQGKTTLKGTAMEQNDILESEIRWDQYWLKRFYEQKIFPLIQAKACHVIWRPLKEEDQNAKSLKICQEIEHGMVSPKFASQLNYPPEALVGAVRLQTLVPVDSPAAQGNVTAAPSKTQALVNAEREARIKALNAIANKSGAASNAKPD